ncbi:MAG: flagellar export chaperone FliS [Oscillospiraceae bacterium]|nr:flagellar export chaperone FliS [Oscillospiraceae bacterium]
MSEPDKNTMLYRENNIASARPEDLTLMMYNGLLKFITRAQEEIRAKSLEAAHNTLIRCQDIVFEFQYTLNMDISVSNNLMLIYDYLYNRLIEANAKKDCDILDEVLEFVTEMRDTWVEAVKLNKEQKAEAAEIAAAEREAAAAEKAAAELGDQGTAFLAGAGDDLQAAAGDAAAEGAEAAVAASTASVASASTAVAAPASTATATPAAPPVGAVSRNKAIYKRTGPLVGIGILPAVPASSAAHAGGAAAMSAAATSAVATSATATSAAATPATPAPEILPIPGAPLKRFNPAAAAQYAKVSKAKAPPQEIISIASE